MVQTCISFQQAILVIWIGDREMLEEETAGIPSPWAGLNQKLLKLEA